MNLNIFSSFRVLALEAVLMLYMYMYMYIMLYIAFIHLKKYEYSRRILGIQISTLTNEITLHHCPQRQNNLMRLQYLQIIPLSQMITLQANFQRTSSMLKPAPFLLTSSHRRAWYVWNKFRKLLTFKVQSCIRWHLWHCAALAFRGEWWHQYPLCEWGQSIPMTTGLCFPSRHESTHCHMPEPIWGPLHVQDCNRRRLKDSLTK